MSEEPNTVIGHARVTAHVSEGLALLPAQFRGKPRIRALMRALLRQVQQTEDALWSLYGLAIDNSSDAALDQVGRVLRMGRGGLLDVEYRRVLRAVVIALRSSGTADEVLRAAAALFDSWDFSYAEAYPAKIVIEPDAPSSLAATTLHAVLRRAKSAGVGLQLVDVPAGDPFSFSDGHDIEDDAARGFSDTGGAAGGLLAGVIA